MRSKIKPISTNSQTIFLHGWPDHLAGFTKMGEWGGGSPHKHMIPKIPPIVSPNTFVFARFSAIFADLLYHHVNPAKSEWMEKGIKE